MRRKSMKMDDDASLPSLPSVKHRIRHSVSFSHCFRRSNTHLRSSPPLPSDGSLVLVWFGIKRPHDRPLSEIKEKCCVMLGISAARHKRRSSTEFGYDPLSYALNFEDGFGFNDEASLRNFSARLSQRPPLPVAAAIS